MAAAAEDTPLKFCTKEGDEFEVSGLQQPCGVATAPWGRQNPSPDTAFARKAPVSVECLTVVSVRLCA